MLTPSYQGLEKALDLPQAATLCGACNSVCPVGIPLSDLLRTLREKQVERGLRPRRERLALACWSFFAKRPSAYAQASRLAARLLRRLGGKQGSIRRLPLLASWSATRDMSAPVGHTFRKLYRQRRAQPRR